MFTRTELDTIFQMVRSKKLSLHQPLTIQASNDPGSEADFFFFRGARKQYESGAHFWLRCVTWLEEYRKGYAVDLAIPDTTLAGGFDYEHVILRPDQFIVLK